MESVNASAVSLWFCPGCGRKERARVLGAGIKGDFTCSECGTAYEVVGRVRDPKVRPTPGKPGRYDCSNCDVKDMGVVEMLQHVHECFGDSVRLD